MRSSPSREKPLRHAFGAKRCPACKRVGCLDHLPVEEDYPASAWDTSHDYGPREDLRD